MCSILFVGEAYLRMFGGFSSFFGKDCSEIETDPKADPFDKYLFYLFYIVLLLLGKYVEQ